MIILDTSAAIEFLRDSHRSKNIPFFSDEIIAICPLSISEILPLYSEKQEKQFNKLLELCIILPFDFECGLQAAFLRDKLRRKGIGFEETDLYLASAALANDATFITCDNDFASFNLSCIKIL